MPTVMVDIKPVVGWMAPLVSECVRPNATNRGKMAANEAYWWTAVGARILKRIASAKRLITSPA
jgi:hypothetical protein